MKKNVIKTAIAAVCVVAAGMGGMKAYNTANQSQADMLLAENVDALSAGDGADGDYAEYFANLFEYLQICSMYHNCPWVSMYENDVCTYGITYNGTYHEWSLTGYTGNELRAKKEN